MGVRDVGSSASGVRSAPTRVLPSNRFERDGPFEEVPQGSPGPRDVPVQRFAQMADPLPSQHPNTGDVCGRRGRRLQAFPLQLKCPDPLFTARNLPQDPLGCPALRDQRHEAVQLPIQATRSTT